VGGILRENPGLSLDQGYILASHGSTAAKAKAGVLESQKKALVVKKAGASPIRGKSTNNGITPKPGVFSDFQSCFDKTKEEMGG